MKNYELATSEGFRKAVAIEQGGLRPDSRSKRNSSRNRKQGKVVRAKGEFKQYDVSYMVDAFALEAAEQEAAQREYDLFTKRDHIEEAKEVIRGMRKDNLTFEQTQDVGDQVLTHLMDLLNNDYITDVEYHGFRKWAVETANEGNECQVCHAPISRWSFNQATCHSCLSELRGE